MRVCRSPKLIAAYHGLHRLRVPRHPPHAFTRLTTTICSPSRAPTNSRDPQPAFQRSGLTCTARNAPCPSLSSVNQIIHRWTKCRHSIRILKSAIYHYFRCQKASTPTTGRSPKRTATYGVKAEIEFGMRMCKTKRLQEIFQYHLTCWGTYSDPLRR
jgi:hypothetical protein